VDYSIRLWDVDTGQCLKVLNHASPVVSVIYSPDGQKLASYGVDQSVRIWDAQENVSRSFSVIAWHFSATFDWGGAIALVPMVKLWRVTVKRVPFNVATGQPLWLVQAHSSPIVAVVYSPDGQQLVSASMDQRIKVWDVKTGVSEN